MNDKKKNWVEIDRELRSLKPKNLNRAEKLKEARNGLSSLTPKNTREFSSEDERIEYYNFQDKKAKREYLEEKYGLDKDTLIFEVDDPKIKNYIKDHSDLIDESYLEALYNIIREHKELKLLLKYDNEELTIGQVAEELDISKSKVMDLLKKYKIPYVRVDEEYLKQEFEAFREDDDKK